MEKEADNGLAIHVAVVYDAIIVTMPGTHYSVTYRKGADPWLLASTVTTTPPFHLASTLFERERIPLLTTKRVS
jgi:hypothetical protein